MIEVFIVFFFFLFFFFIIISMLIAWLEIFLRVKHEHLWHRIALSNQDIRRAGDRGDYHRGSMLPRGRRE